MIGALLIDFDGTITEPFFDWPAIKKEMGITGLVLDAIAAGDIDEKERLWTIMRRFEAQAVEDARLRDGAVDLLEFLRIENIPHAVVTNNTLSNIRAVEEKCGISINIVVSRDDGSWKPSPRPLLDAANRLGVQADACVMLGDSAIDTAGARELGMKTIQLTSSNSTNDADFNPTDLYAAIEILRKLNRLEA